MCCGQKRSQLQNSLTPTPAPSTRQYVPTNRQAVRTPTTRSHMGPSTPQPRIGSQGRLAVPPIPVQATTPAESVTIRYLETAPVRVRGLTTGRTYEFSDSQPIQSIDARDALSLLSTRFFRRA